MKLHAVAAVLGLLFASSCITEPICACSPPGGGSAVMTGSVTDPQMAPVEGARVNIRVVKDETCEEPVSTITRSAASDAAGRFRHVEAWSGGRKCFQVWAEPPQGSSWSESEAQFVRIDFLHAAVPDSVELLVALR